MGAWIEINTIDFDASQLEVAPVWGRGLKSNHDHPEEKEETVAPVWGRGLK